MVSRDVIGRLFPDGLPVAAGHVFVREPYVAIIGDEPEQHPCGTRPDQLLFDLSDPHD